MGKGGVDSGKKGKKDAQKKVGNLKARKSVPVFWPPFSPVRRGLFPVVRDFLCIIPTEQILYYRNLGLYYGLASGTLPLYSDPCLGVRGGCVACDSDDSQKLSRAVPEYCWLSRLVSGMAPNQGPSVLPITLKTLTSLNKEVRPFFLSDNSIWSLPSLSSLSDYSIWRS